MASRTPLMPALLTVLLATAVALPAVAQAPSGGTPAVANGGRLQQIQAQKRVRVCIWPDYYGISQRSPRAARLLVIDPEIG